MMGCSTANNIVLLFPNLMGDRNNIVRELEEIFLWVRVKACCEGVTY